MTEEYGYNLELPLPSDRWEVAAMLLDRDEGGNLMVWARRQILAGKDAIHDGDCTKQCHSCQRCQADRAFADADRIIAFVTAQ